MAHWERKTRMIFLLISGSQAYKCLSDIKKQIRIMLYRSYLNTCATAPHTCMFQNMQQKDCNENRWQPIFALAENLLHLTLTLWGAWLARQQILQSVSHDCISIVQISLLIPSPSVREVRPGRRAMCSHLNDMLTGNWQPIDFILHPNASHPSRRSM